MAAATAARTVAVRIDNPNHKGNGQATPLQYALALAGLGYRVVPHTTVETKDQNRHPYLQDWPNQASNAPHVITNWATAFQRAGGVGIVAGDDTTLGLEIDEPANPALSKLLKAIPRKAAVVLSGGGGLHVYFKHNAYSKQQLLPLRSPSIKGQQREKALELYTMPHPFLAPGTVHYKTGKVYQWRDADCTQPTQIPSAVVDALLALPWQVPSAVAAQPGYVSAAEIVLRSTVDARELMASVGLHMVQGSKFAATRPQPCPQSGTAHKSATTWVFFYKPQQHSLRFFCHSCKTGDTRAMLQQLGIDVDSVAMPSTNVAAEQDLLLTSLTLADAVPRCEQLLVERGTGREGIFRRGQRLVQVAQYRDVKQSEQLRRMDPNTNLMVPLSTIAVRHELSTLRKIYTHTVSGGWRPADAPLEWAQDIIDRAERRSVHTPWPCLYGVSRTPILLEDGTVVQEPGYHAASGMWLDIDPSAFPKLPAKPTKKDALQALHKFDALFERFPFVDTEGEPVTTAAVNKDWHKSPGGSVIISAVLSILARNLLDVVPAIALDAPTQRTGKTKLSEAAAGASTGLWLDPTDYKNEEEFGKSLLPLLRNGLQAVLVDNVTKYFSSASLSIAITTPGEVHLRRLGESDMECVRNTAVIFITGNNLMFTGDMARGRVIKCVIDARMEHPEFRDFNNVADPPEYARAHFPQLAVAGLTMLKAYMRAQCPWPAKLAHAGTFKRWSQLVRGCLLWLGCADPWLTTIDVSDDDPYHDQDVALLEQWHRYLKDSAVTLAELRSSHFIEDASHLTGKKSLFAELFGDERSTTEVSVGAWLNHLRRRVTGEYRLVVIKTKGHSNRYKVVKDVQVAAKKKEK